MTSHSRTANGSRPLVFLRGFLRNPKEVGSVIPSSRYLIRRVLDRGRVSRAQVIVELGAGTGVVTREILRRMPRSARLVAVEINPRFVRVLRRALPDPRLSVFEGSCADLEHALEGAGVEKADLVVSGIPFSTIGHGEGYRTLQAAKRILGPDGRFVAYQFRSHVRRLAEPLFGPAETHRGLWNLPPMRIYVWPAAGVDS
jgi:phospholipid N-methyltransferase